MAWARVGARQRPLLRQRPPTPPDHQPLKFSPCMNQLIMASFVRKKRFPWICVSNFWKYLRNVNSSLGHESMGKKASWVSMERRLLLLRYRWSRLGGLRKRSYPAFVHEDEETWEWPFDFILGDDVWL
ncbi:hypothetical protein Tco_0755860 [Tanacetum coccineum]